MPAIGGDDASKQLLLVRQSDLSSRLPIPLICRESLCIEGGRAGVSEVSLRRDPRRRGSRHCVSGGCSVRYCHLEYMCVSQWLEPCTSSLCSRSDSGGMQGGEEMEAANDIGCVRPLQLQIETAWLGNLSAILEI